MENNVYNTIAERLGAPGSSRFIKILEAYFTPEEGKIILELQGNPMTLTQLANRLKVDEKSLSAKLEDLDYRGLITRGKTLYAAPAPKGDGHPHSSLTRFHHLVAGCALVPYPPSKKIKDLWADFFWNEWTDIEFDSFVDRVKATGRPFFMVWPATSALDLSPNIKPEQILPEEDFRLTLKKAKRIVAGPCTCRLEWGVGGEGCSRPLLTCWHIDNPAADYYLKKQERVSGLKELSLDEALETLRAGEEAGLVRTGICMCCGCCCHILYSLKKYDRMHDLIDPSRYRAAIDEERCVGCQTCVERCFFNAIEMRKTPGSKKLKASIINDYCMGCGVCIVGCKQKAMRYEIVRPPQHITNRPRFNAKGGLDLYGLE
jgi:Na+-translocating ferredoxin:NAD+ oxidoreductase subunit B